MDGEGVYIFPEFDALPKVEGQPQGCLWGFFDKHGTPDQIGSKLNFGHMVSIPMHVV